MARKWTKLALSVLAAGIISTSALSVSADEANDIKYRKSVMKAIGGTMGSMAAIIKGKVKQNHAVPLSHAMARLSVTIKDVFPEGSDFGDTRAKPDIWKKPKEFKASVAAFEKAASNLAMVSKSGDPAAFAAAFGGLGKSCGGCHKPFREPKK